MIRLLNRIFNFKFIAQRRILRASKLYHKKGLFRILGLLLHQFNLRRFPCEIYPHVKIGANFYMPHYLGVVIGKTAIIGNNVTIFPNVVIGSKRSIDTEEDKTQRRHAIIGDNCLIGTHAVILGAIIIGDNVTIAANSVVDKDVPSNTLVYGYNQFKRKNFKED